MMTVTPQLRNLVKKLPCIGCIHIRMQENIMYVLCIVVHCASVLSCSRPSLPRMCGGMHLLIDG